MLKTFTYGFIVLTLLLLSGCTGFVTLPSGEAEEFTVRKNECGALLGSTSKEVQDLFGPPHNIFLEDKVAYFIYQWRSTCVGAVLIGYIPIPIGYEKDTELHCILLEFGEDDVLRNYKIDTECNKGVSDAVYQSCAEVFGMKASASVMPASEYDSRNTRAMLTPLASELSLCRAADSGYPEAMFKLGVLYEGGQDGFPIDPTRAYMWYRISASTANYDKAAIQAERLLKELSPEQEFQAEMLVREWEPGQCERDLNDAAYEGNE